MEVLWFFVFMTGISLVESHNIAFNKPAGQTGQFGDQSADRAVDGDLQRCAHPDNVANEPVRWWVDLEETYRVTNITIVNTNDGGGFPRLTQFALSVGPSLTDLTDCGPVYTDDVSPGALVSIGCNLVGQFVQFRRVGGTEVDRVTLCEVIVSGQRQYSCDLCPTGVACDVTAGCSQCAPGKLPVECSSDCPDGSYGLSCSSDCGRCVQNSDCDPVDGVCSGGCQRWWILDRCQDEIVLPNQTSESVEVGDVTSSSIQVRWEQIRTIPDNLNSYYGYRVSYIKTSDGSRVDIPDIIGHTSDVFNSFVVTSLEHETVYHVSITPVRVWTDGSEDHSTTSFLVLDVRTKCGQPDVPRDVKAELRNSDMMSIDVTWESTSTADLRARCSIRFLRVDYRRSGDTTWIESDELEYETTRYLITPSGGGSYEVRVSLVNGDGFMGSSMIQTVTVPGPTPAPVPATTARPTTTTTTKQTTLAGEGPLPTPSTTVAITDTTTTAAPPTVGGDKKAVKIAVPIVVVVIIVGVAVALAVIFIRRRRKKNNGSMPDIDLSDAGSDNLAFDNPPDVIQSSKPLDSGRVVVTFDKIKKSLSIKSRPSLRKTSSSEANNNGLLNEFDKGPVPVSQIPKLTATKKANMDRFEAEYRSLPPDDKSRCVVGRSEGNVGKNRFKNIFPYDDTRVILDIDGSCESDYINANYISGYYSAKEYIATQGPRKDTTDDFWHMIWQKKADRIVMVTNLSENGKTKCHQYWPKSAGKSVSFGVYDVTLEAEEICADYTHRVLTVTRGTDSRTVRQCHFTSWEDKNKPKYGPISLFTFHRKVHSLDRMSTGPIVVHCSAGVGRTGTFLAFDILANQAREEDQVDIYGCVKNMRNERMNMVQTKEQYFFLHDALVEFLKSGETTYPCTNFSDVFAELVKPNMELQGVSEMAHQFKNLCSLKPRVKEHGLDGLKASNKDKNRDLTVVPDDMHRPYLNTNQRQGSNYINAVFVSSFQAHRQYLATQMPLESTVVDFWRLVHDQSCNTIVMLNGIPDNEQVYWPSPDQPKQRFGPIEVELVDDSVPTDLPSVTARDFRIKNVIRGDADPEMAVRHFQLMTWSEDEDLPSNKQDILDLMVLVRKWHQKMGFNPQQSHTIVHCMNGADKTGVYCSALYMTERMKIEQEIDVFMSARYTGRSRSQFINNLDQYQSLYKIALQCLSTYSAYANFD